MPSTGSYPSFSATPWLLCSTSDPSITCLGCLCRPLLFRAEYLRHDLRLRLQTDKLSNRDEPKKIHETRQGTKLRCRLMRQGKKLRWTMTVLQWVVLCSQTSTHSSLLKPHLISITASHDFLSLNIEMRRGQILLAIAKKKVTVSCANSQYKSLFGFFQWHAFRKLINKISKQKLLNSRKRAALPHKTPTRGGFVTAKKRNCQNNGKQSRIFSFELVNFLIMLFSFFPPINYVIINSPRIYSSLHLNKIQLSTTSILKSLFEAKKKTNYLSNFSWKKKNKMGKGGKSTFHHCPMQSKGNCRHAYTPDLSWPYCSAHQYVCYCKGERSHLKTENCYRCHSNVT